MEKLLSQNTNENDDELHAPENANSIELADEEADTTENSIEIDNKEIHSSENEISTSHSETSLNQKDGFTQTNKFWVCVFSYLRFINCIGVSKTRVVGKAPPSKSAISQTVGVIFPFNCVILPSIPSPHQTASFMINLLARGKIEQCYNLSKTSGTT